MGVAACAVACGQDDTEHPEPITRHGGTLDGPADLAPRPDDPTRCSQIETFLRTRIVDGRARIE